MGYILTRCCLNMRMLIVINLTKCYIITIKCRGNNLVRFAIAFLLLILSQLTLAKGLVVSTHPLLLIAQDVTKGIEQPVLLLSPQQTGHDVQLTPKSRQIIQNANLILWIGEAHEAPLKQVLQGQSKAIALLDTAMMKTLPSRNARGQAIKGTLDTHIWLEPHNAVRIAFFIAALRSQQYPENKAKYWQNAQNFAQRLYDATKVQHTKNTQFYWAYHDAYQYLERSLNLTFAGALSPDHDLKPTATQMHYLNKNRPSKKMCLLAEYHADQALVAMLKPVVHVTVDEAMSNQTDFVEAWLKLAHAVKQCD